MEATSLPGACALLEGCCRPTAEILSLVRWMRLMRTVPTVGEPVVHPFVLLQRYEPSFERDCALPVHGQHGGLDRAVD